MIIAELYYKYIKKIEPPYYAKYSFLKIILKPLKKVYIHNIIPYCPFNKLRVLLYKLAGFRIGKNVSIGMKCYLDDMEPHLISIEDNAIISFEVCLVVHGRYQEHTPILVKKNSYIGCRATILSGKKGVVIGENSVIGACSLVNKSIPDNMIFAGVPAKIIRTIEKEKK